jgi:hypothetical protein
MFAKRLYKFANLLSCTGRLEQAETAFGESIHIGELTLGKDHSLLADWKSGLAKVLRDCGRYAEAEPLFREAIATWMKTGNHSHTSFGFLRHEYAKLLSLCGRPEEACAQAREALDIHVCRRSDPRINGRSTRRPFWPAHSMRSGVVMKRARYAAVTRCPRDLFVPGTRIAPSASMTVRDRVVVHETDPR